MSEEKPWHKYKKKINDNTSSVKPWDMINGSERATVEEADRRFAICQSCPELIKLTGQCKKCGCFMAAKTKLEKATCPIGKWDGENNTDKTIFINIPSYSDPEIWDTIEDFISKATNSSRVFFGITHQTFDLENDLLKSKTNSNNVKMDIIPAGSIIGCQPGRKNSHQFYDGQDYYLNMDSHMRAVENWDSLIIKDFEDLELKNGKSVMTGYVNSYDVNENGKSILNKETPWLFYMSEDNVLNFKNNGVLQMCPKHGNHTEPVLSPYISGHFFFARGRYVERVNFVEEITFTEEELFMAVRFFTAGYNIYIPSSTYVFHRYGRPNRRLIWEDFPEKFYSASEASKNFSVYILENNILSEKNGLFTERTLEEFEKYASISFKTREVGLKIINGDEPKYIN
jgi:hypothetical protein